MIRRLVSVCLFLASLLFAQEPKTELLWPNGAPAAVGSEDADRPTLTIHLPPAGRAVGSGVVICPGGGYTHLALDHEGKQVAEWFNSLGVAAFVLKYRLGPRYRHPAPLQDAQRAIRAIRTRAREFGVTPDRIGIMGFSAGGHLASTAGTHFDTGDRQTADPIDRTSSRPDFLILAYPVISFTEEYRHRGSPNNLLGPSPDQALLELLSGEKHVTPQTPPAFLFHTNEDRGVLPENSVAFYLALRKAGVPAELHIYEPGRHGLGLASQHAILSSWPERLKDWLLLRGLLGN